MGKFTLILFVLLLCTGSVAAADLSSNEFYFRIIGSKIYAENKITFRNSFSGNYFFELPRDAKGISLYVDNASYNFSNPLILNNAKEIRINYITSYYLSGNNFIINIKPKQNIDYFSVKIVLPEDIKLAKPASEGSVYPKPTSITSDGQSIILFWEKSNFTEKDEMPILVVMKQESNMVYFIVVAGIIIVLIILFVVYLSLKRAKDKPEIKPRKKPKKSRIKAKVKEEVKLENKPDILEHLKEQEQQVVRVLQQREGQCEQGTLRVVTGIPKATLSRILMELEDRKIIYKEKRGKKNIIFLK